MELFLSALSIFLLRIGDVSISSVRIVTLMRGRIGLAAAMGFFESLFWVVAAAIVFSAGIHDPLRMVAFAGGFATGTLLGGHIERWLAMGTAFIRVVTPIEESPVAEALRVNGYPVTVLNAEGRDGEVRVNFLVLPRRKVKEALTIIADASPNAFVTVEDIRIAEIARHKGAGSAIRK